MADALGGRSNFLIGMAGSIIATICFALAGAMPLFTMAWMANRFGPSASNAFEDLDEWCPTSPKKIKLPAWWPPIPDPDPHPNWFTDFQIGFITRLAAASTQFENTSLGQVFDKAMDRTVSSMKTGNTRG